MASISEHMPHSNHVQINTENTESTGNGPKLAILLDLMGFVFMVLGLGQQYGRHNVLPQSLDFAYSGTVMMAVGLLLTLPFMVVALKASDSALKSLAE